MGNATGQPVTKWHGAIVVLGAPNDDDGNLSVIARGRLDAGVKLAIADSSLGLVLTGGYGPQFNSTRLPHAHYARDYVLQSGVPPHQILAIAESSSTVEDATCAKPIIDDAGINSLTIVTSDYHLKRARRVFGVIFNCYERRYVAVPTSLTPSEVAALRAHEEAAMARLDGEF